MPAIKCAAWMLIALTASFGQSSLDRQHEVLRNHPEPHDTYIALAEFATEDTVPLLLERLRIDHGASEPPPAQAAVHAIVCTQDHLVNVLRSVTNTDQGLYYPRWFAWWEANRRLTRRQWILNGFAAAGLRVAEPLDERFALGLIDIMGKGPPYRALNARRLLEEVPAGVLNEWVGLAAAAGDPSRRLGAIAVLAQIDRDGHEDSLRALARDPDLDVMREALTVLNDRRRAPFLNRRAERPIRRPTDRMKTISSVSLSGDRLMVTLQNGEQLAFDIWTRRQVWSGRPSQGSKARTDLVTGSHRPAASETTPFVVEDGERRFVLTDRDLEAFRISDGGILWASRGGQESDDRMVSTPYGLLLQNRHYMPELRDSDSGEVQRLWPQIRGMRYVAAEGRFAALVDVDDDLWLVDLASGRSDQVSRSSNPW